MAMRRKSASSSSAPKAPPAARIARSETKGSGTVVTPRSDLIAPPKLTYEEVATRAYQIYLKRGFGPGDSVSDWLEAERQLKSGL